VKANLPVIRSVATLTYDGRRSDFFKAHLFDALRIVDRGDLTPAEMRRAWAGEMAATQFMPSNYVGYAIDFDGDGHADLLRSPANVLASTAHYLQGHGWVRGGDWEPGSPNCEAIRAWNKSQVYSRTIAYYASSSPATRHRHRRATSRPGKRRAETRLSIAHPRARARIMKVS
jgi:membrane-bound lytic murein transglycosylase B